MRIGGPENKGSYFFLSVETADDEYKSGRRFLEFNEAFNYASSVLKSGKNVYQVYIFHCAEYENNKPRLLTTVSLGSGR